MHWCELPNNLSSKIETVTESGCWIWVGCCHKSGYGKTCINTKLMYAHRAVYSMLVAPIPEGLTLDHLCRVRCCVNPSHLEAVTIKVNVLRGESPSSVNSRKAHCSKGHGLGGANLIINSRGNRVCRICTNERTVQSQRRHPRKYDPKEYIKHRARIRLSQNAYYSKKRRIQHEPLLPRA